MERHSGVVCPAYAAKEEGSFQRKVPSKERTKPTTEGLEPDFNSLVTQIIL